jgi:hypothetical protein
MARRESYQRWTAAELDYLAENYSDETAADIARALGRTPDSVWEKATRQGLRKHAKRHARSAEGPWHCPKCSRTKPIEEFGKSDYCKECNRRLWKQRSYAQERRKRNPRP